MSTAVQGRKTDIDLLAHLYRRAGFGATRDQLERYATRGYEDIVESLLNPDPAADIQNDVLDRYYGGEAPAVVVGTWLYRMLNSECQLQEKMTLFWHHVFATGIAKNEHILASKNQIAMFRRVGLSDLRTILIELSRDPAMIFWLDNNENHKGEPNENYGRELLELFSMGVGNYTEQDIKNAARAFTGWTFSQPPPLYPHGHYPAPFVFREDDHDDGVKTFLGETGRLNGDDIVEIIVKQPATARFIARHLYNFFVADEPQVPTWNEVPPQDTDAIAVMEKAFMESGGEIRSMLRVMFNSDFFKEARFKKIKSPTELVVGVLKMVGTFRDMIPGISQYANATALMGQQLLNPPTVEGWHTGKEWIDGGNLTERVNFAIEEIGDGTKPGIKEFVDRLRAEDSLSSPENLVDGSLDLLGPLTVSDMTRDSLLQFAKDSVDENDESRIVRMLRLIVATPEFQFA